MNQINQQLEHWAYLACLMEATAQKPGNVHPQASFPDLTYADFVKSAAVIAPLLACTTPPTVGQTILNCIRATQTVSSSNSNLGIVLLLAPLMAVSDNQTVEDGIEQILDQLTVQDTRDVYAAIRLAHPGGLGTSDTEDVSEEPSGTLRDVMRLAADRDSIASEYATAFQITLKTAVPALQEYWNQSADWEEAMIRLQLRLMSDFPDTLIARKCGSAEASQAASRAQAVLSAEHYTAELKQFDSWLRQNGNQRNPGTTADLIVATLFVALRDGFITPPPIKTIEKHVPPQLKSELKIDRNNESTKL